MDNQIYSTLIYMRNKFLLYVFLYPFLISGCQSNFGPSALKTTHPSYNEAIVSSLSQQMLLNLVRLKYRDSSYFLKVGSVTASLTFGSNIGVGTKLDVGSGVSSVSPSLGVSYTDRPTITYSPLQGEDFLKFQISLLLFFPYSQIIQYDFHQSQS